MTAPYSGGFEITDMYWEGPAALRVAFTSTYGSDYQYQLYVNRILSGSTEEASDREITAVVQPSEWPQEIQLLAVDTLNVNTDYGAYLPPRPYNQAKLTIDGSSWTDAVRIEVTSGNEPGGDVDSSNIIGRILYDEAREYVLITDPLQGNGEWKFEAYGVDGTLPEGNHGSATAASVEILSRPPDVTFADDGSRFTAQAVAGTLTVTFEEY